LSGEGSRTFSRSGTNGNIYLVTAADSQPGRAGPRYQRFGIRPELAFAEGCGPCGLFQNSYCVIDLEVFLSLDTKHAPTFQPADLLFHLTGKTQETGFGFGREQMS
jgi:hypothetical protein